MRRVVFRSRPPRLAPVIVHAMRPIDTSRLAPVVPWDDPAPRADLRALLDRINAVAGNHPLPLAHAAYADRPMATVHFDLDAAIGNPRACGDE